MQLTALLFDLDGTLLPMDLDEFMKGYFKELIPHIAHVVDREKIVKQIWDATMDMIQNEDPNTLNIDVFKKSFFAATGLSEEQIWPLFDEFYENVFGILRHLTQPTDISREICRTAVDKGYDLVIATNPIFPERAIRHRMAWAGIDDIPFRLVTTMENSHFCKPNPKYYVEILDKLGKSPFECIMFGNDVQEDGIAGKVGMQTFLVKDCLIDHGDSRIDFTHEGSLEDVLRFVQDLPVLTPARR
ncbi:MAG: HAD family hydrolase [Thermoflavifilum sp.]|nr:HAD family hydrolase [Thermoflavifilum sp.]MCL6514213.1 HAD family hydrolase [Alicyclobacillus sp.]